jgi:hypothetical protein
VELNDLHAALRCDGVTKRKNALKDLADLLQSELFAKQLVGGGGARSLLWCLHCACLIF